MKKTLSLTSLFLAMTVSCSYAAQNTVAINPPKNSPGFSQEQVKQIEQIIHNYLVNKNPQVMIEVAQNLQRQELDKEKIRVKTGVMQHDKDIFNSNQLGRIVLGNPNGNIVLAEFLSYECGHCREMNPLVERLIKNNPNLKVILIYWPFQGNDAIYAAKVAIAAKAQGKFAQLHDAFMAFDASLNKDAVDKIVKKVGLNEAKLQQDIKQMETAVDAGLLTNSKLAENLKLVGTPTFVVTNNTLTKFSVVPGAGSEAELTQAIGEVR
jgi:protein-disulfide isomerase